MRNLADHYFLWLVPHYRLDIIECSIWSHCPGPCRGFRCWNNHLQLLWERDTETFSALSSLVWTSFEMWRGRVVIKRIVDSRVLIHACTDMHAETTRRRMCTHTHMCAPRHFIYLDKYGQGSYWLNRLYLHSPQDEKAGSTICEAARGHLLCADMK